MSDRVLVAGATGAVGARVLAALERTGRRVRALSRSRGRLAGGSRSRHGHRRGDVRDARALVRALDGVGSAVYLVHSLGARGSFGEDDREAARVFALPTPSASPESPPLSRLASLAPAQARLAWALLDSHRFDTSVERPPPPGLFRVRPRGLEAAAADALQAETAA